MTISARFHFAPEVHGIFKLHTVCGKFDYIVAAGIIERSENPEEMLAALKPLLKPLGKLLIGAENRLAIRYFCGDKDSFSGHVLDGIDGYLKVSDKRMKINGGTLIFESGI